MKKLINHVDTVLTESLDGFAAAHADIILLAAEREFVRRKHHKPGKVALISGGGSGHEPLHAGFVGCSITATVAEPEFLALWDAPVHTPALRWGM